VSDHNCPRGAGVRPGPTRPWPAHRCPSCGIALNGSPVVFWCTGCDRRVQASGRHRECRSLGRRGRAE
jgi:hypothetical protein